MRNHPTSSTLGVLARLGLLALLTACGSSGGTVDTQGLEKSERSIATRPRAGASSPVVAVVGNTPLTWEDLRPYLAEAAGGEVLEELIVVHALRARLAALGETLSRDELHTEQRRLFDAMKSSAGADDSTVEDLAVRFRRSRRLGPERYALLLERNALLTRLNAPLSALTPEEREVARAIRFGPRYRVRMLLLPSMAEIGAARDRIASSSDFADAITREALGSALNAELAPGGEVEPISPYDEQYPGALRSMLLRLAPGELSPVIALDGSYAVLVVREVVAGNAAPTEHELARADEEAREFKLRRLNQLTIRDVLDGPGVGVLEPSLRWSWEARRSQAR